MSINKLFFNRTAKSFYQSSFSEAAKSAHRPYKRPYRASYGFIIFAIFVLVMSWEVQKMDAAIAGGAIPEEAIRLRILANSDKPEDQLVKRLVRDEVVNAMNGWAVGLKTIEEARTTIDANLPELERIVNHVLQNRGFDYGFKVELGQVEFPTKMYGNTVYPAGEYEALRITLGEAEGQNWWCVLFPPLCFVDAATGEGKQTDTAVKEAVVPVSAGATEVTVANAASDVSNASDASVQTASDAPEVKFFLFEMLEALLDWIASLFK